MLDKQFPLFVKLYNTKTTFVCILVAAIILLIDFSTGRYIRFPIFYVLPIWMAAWRNKKNLAFALALFLPAARFGIYYFWHVEEVYILLSNTLIAELALILYAYLMIRVRWQTNALKIKVKKLEGILPICSSCKRIRNEKGEYEQVDRYISEHSDALFSHGLCKECTRKLYPEYSDEE